MKYYNLTSKPNEGIKDKEPEWLDNFFKNSETMSKTASAKFNGFAGVKDPILNPENKGVKEEKRYCKKCGKELSEDEIDICKECNNKTNK